MQAHSLHVGLRILLSIAGTLAVLISLALEYPFYRMLLFMLLTGGLLLIVL